MLCPCTNHGSENESCTQILPHDLYRALDPLMRRDFVPVPIVVAGASVTLTQAIVSMFPLRDFVDGSTRTPVSQHSITSGVSGNKAYDTIHYGFYIYGAEADDNDADLMGKLWFLTPSYRD